MKTKTVSLLFSLALLSGVAGGEIRTHTARITLPDGAQMSCWSIESPYGSTTRCGPTRPASRDTRTRVEISITPENEAAWDTAYKYIKKARTRKGWKPRLNGPLGTLIITSDTVSLNSERLDRSDSAIEADIWTLTRQSLGITDEDIETGTTITSR